MCCGPRYAYEHTPTLNVEVADLAAILLPPDPPPLFGVGGGLSFRGGPGALPMKVVSCDATEVVTLSARWTLHASNSTIVLRQRIDSPDERVLAIWTVSVPFTNLRVLREPLKSPGGECVVGNDHISIGVQVDGMLGIVPADTNTDSNADENGRVECTVECAFPSNFNRFYNGHLLAQDDFGGFTVSPVVVVGSGRKPQCSVVTNNNNGTSEPLDFLSLARNDTNFTSSGASAQGKWRFQWTLERGDRLFSSVMPVRPYVAPIPCQRGGRVTLHIV